MDGCGSNKLCTHLQHDHKNDKVDSSMAVMSDLKQITSKETLLPTQGVFNENHSIIREYSLFIFTKKVKTSQIASLRLNFPLLKSRLCSTLLIVKHNIFLDSSFVLVILLHTQSRYNVSSCDQQHQVLINSNKRQSLILILLRSFFF